MDISRPHDTFFRFLVSKMERAIDFARYHIPSSIGRHIQFDTMSSEPDTFVDSQLQHRYSDALFKVRTGSGNPAYVYLLLDHKSAPDPDVPLQLQRYINHIWDRYLTNHPGSVLPPILGMVIYHGLRPWNIDTDLKSRFDCPEDFFPYLPVFRYLLVDLSAWSDDQFQGGADLRAALMLLKYIFYPNLQDYLPMILKVLKEGRHQPDFLAFFEAFMLYLLKYLDQKHHEKVEKLVLIEMPEEGGQAMPTVADKLREEGREEVREELQTKWAKGILKLLQSKFHALPPAMQDKITSVRDQSILEALMDQAIEAESLDRFKHQMELLLS